MLAETIDDPPRERERRRTGRTRGVAGAQAWPALPLLVAHRRGKRRILQIDDIVWIQAAGNYARVHVRDGSHLVRVPMHVLDRALAPRGFLRVHRSALVPLREMFELVVEAGGATMLLLRSGPRLAVSREFRRRLDAVSLGEESTGRAAENG